MKTLLSALIILATTHQAMATAGDVISCYDRYSKSPTPIMTAITVSQTTLRDIRFNTSEEYKDVLLPTRATVTGTMVVSNHSPYKGTIQYVLPGNIRLLLPANLSKKNLETSLATGIGSGKNENGVLIGYYTGGDSEGGNHFSVRLVCKTDR